MSVLSGFTSKGRSCRIALIAIILSILLSGCDVKLFSELDERNANDILLVLSQNRISANKTQVEPGVWQISVQSDVVQPALAIVSRHGLPRAQFVSLGDVFAKEGLIATPSEERQRYAFAVSQELSHTLMQIDGVVVARVHPVIPLIDPLSERIPTSSAAVFIKHLHDADLEPMVPAIKRLVSQSIEGLDPDDVALTFSAAAPVPVDTNPQPAEADRLETSSLVISGLLVLAALVIWPVSRLSLRLSGNSGARSRTTTNNSWQSMVAWVKQRQTNARAIKNSHSNQDGDDGWNG